MSIRFSCSCGRKLKVSDEKIGMKVLCSSCGATLKVPKKSQDEYWQDVPTKDQGPKVDYAGAFKIFLFQIVPGVAFLGALSWLAYFLSNQMILGRNGLPALGRVSGQVLLDEKPLGGATIHFIPVDPETGKERTDASVATAISDETGHYTLIYVKNVPGAAVGKNRVQIEARDASGREKIPPEFNAKTTLTRDVTSGSQVFDFKVPGMGTPTANGAPPAQQEQ